MRTHAQDIRTHVHASACTQVVQAPHLPAAPEPAPTHSPTQTHLLPSTCPPAAAGHYPTWESAVQGFASARALGALRKKAAAAKGRVDLQIPGPKPPRQLGPVFDTRVGAWTLPFMGGWVPGPVVDGCSAARQRTCPAQPPLLPVGGLPPARFTLRCAQPSPAVLPPLMQRLQGSACLLIT